MSSYSPSDVRQITNYDPLRFLVAVSKADAEGNLFFLEFRVDDWSLFLKVRTQFHQMHPNVISGAYVHGDYLIEAELESADDSLRLRAMLLQALDERHLSLTAKS